MKHNIRCGVCNKFITEEDVLDDGLCEKCASLISRRVSDGLTYWKTIFYVLIAANLILIFWR